MVQSSLLSHHTFTYLDAFESNDPGKIKQKFLVQLGHYPSSKYVIILVENENKEETKSRH